MPLVISKDALDIIGRVMSRRDRERLLEKAQAFAADPFAPYPWVMRLRGEPDRVRIRQGGLARHRVDCAEPADRYCGTGWQARRDIPMSDVKQRDEPGADTVTLTRAEYEALIERIEDAEDTAALDRLEARLAADGDAALADYLPIERVNRLFDGAHPIAVWREHRGLSREALAVAAGLAPDRVAAIETWEQPGSFIEIAKLAGALRLSLDDIAIWLRDGTGDNPVPSAATPR
jgi:hypothetical protein